MNAEPTVFIVEDDEPVRSSLQWLIQSSGLRAETFANANEFLNRYDPAAPGCLLLDVRLPGMSGLELQERLNQLRLTIPVIIMTAHADVPMAVKAMKAGAEEFLEKPFQDYTLLDRVRRAIEKDVLARTERARLASIRARLITLTRRERQVLGMIIEGKSTKCMAQELELSVKTVEAHRGHVMEKMRAENLAHLVRMGVEAETASGA